MPNCATADGTGAYARHFAELSARGHFRSAHGLQLSTIGLGTYLGEADARSDAAYRETITAALQRGCNVIDSAINYRFQRSERVIGEAFARAFSSGRVAREELVIATKGGYLSFDANPPRDPGQWFRDTFVASGIASADDLVAGCHCMRLFRTAGEVD
jgi:aryl-alcohol dehydrogenase-like predicted oxidoreductase